MRVLVVGGSGYVGGLVLPALAEHHTLRIFDLRPPAAGWEWIQGNVCDPEALAGASQGMEALLYMAMAPTDASRQFPPGPSFDVNVKGVYLALEGAQKAGISHAVYTSSMSVYKDLESRFFADEDLPPDAQDAYGFTKRIGEEVCRNAANAWGMTVNVLRLCHPLSDDRWAKQSHPLSLALSTTASDVARALLAALKYQGHGFQAFNTSGDYQHQQINMSRAKRLLDWEPLARPKIP